MKILIQTVLFFVLTSVAYFYFLCEPSYINSWEIRYYIGFVLLTSIVTAFGVLRIYNAVVAQTRYLNALKKDSRDFLSKVSDMNRIHEKLNSRFSTFTQAISNLEKNIKK